MSLNLLVLYFHKTTDRSCLPDYFYLLLYFGNRTKWFSNMHLSSYIFSMIWVRPASLWIINRQINKYSPSLLYSATKIQKGHVMVSSLSFYVSSMMEEIQHNSWKHLYTPVNESRLKWLLYRCCTIVYYYALRHHNPCLLKCKLIQQFNVKNLNVWNTISSRHNPEHFVFLPNKIILKELCNFHLSFPELSLFACSFRIYSQ